MQKIAITKMSGSGNYFILIDNRQNVAGGMNLKEFIIKVCRRKMSAGADGLILIESSTTADFRWQFFNSDGSRAEMCGNGARCAARFAWLNGVTGQRMTFETDAGVVSAEVVGERVKVGMTDPRDLKTDFTVALKNGPRRISSFNTGVPHVVVEVDGLEAADVVGEGRQIRTHRDFAPAGTNVNFVAPRTGGGIAVRTYERGVEDETLACGTGSVAAALVAAHKYGRPSPVDVLTRSGIVLTVHFTVDNGRFRRVQLEGDARVIYTGDLWPDAWAV
jgi:diaminopimelate epimerase